VTRRCPTQALQLIDGLGADATIADKDHDANHLHEKIAQ
jgi:hypothetical protein